MLHMMLCICVSLQLGLKFHHMFLPYTMSIAHLYILDKCAVRNVEKFNEGVISNWRSMSWYKFQLQLRTNPVS